MSLNRVVLVGRLTADPEMKYTPTGVPVASLRIAVNRISKNEQGDYEADFFNVTAWRRTAEFCSNYLTKGRLISLDGRLQTRSWVDQASGQKRTAFEIVADNIEGLDRRDVGGSEAGEDPAVVRDAARPAAAARTYTPTAPADINDDSDPFADE
jgi:single-strand DNA-binding protein